MPRRSRSVRYGPHADRNRQYANGVLRRGIALVVAFAISYFNSPGVEAQAPPPRQCIDGVCPAPHLLNDTTESAKFGEFKQMNYRIAAPDDTRMFETTQENLEPFLDEDGKKYKEHRWSMGAGRGDGVDYIVRYPDDWVFCDSYILVPGENTWWQELRAFIYLICLLYLFLGVAIIADIFMSSIEKITAEKPQMLKRSDGSWEEQKDADGNVIMVKTWNETVANLTLLALGSSAPEILLSLMETLGSLDQEPGELGPSTIVGSAAFNLLGITGVCMYAMKGQTKKIKEFGVFCITSFFSIFAYIWLLIVLQFSSPDVVDMWEAWLTFLFFPLLVILAYCQDRRWFRSARVEPLQRHRTSIFVEDTESLHREISCVKQSQTSHGEVDEDEIARAITKEHRPVLNRGHYRCNATRRLVAKPQLIGSSTHSESVSPHGSSQHCGVIGFLSPTYVCSEGDGKVLIDISRQAAANGDVQVHFVTQDLTAKAGKHYTFTEGDVLFSSGEMGSKTIEIPIIDDSKMNADRTFTVKVTSTPPEALGPICHTVVTIEDDDLPGDATFTIPFTTVAESKKVVSVLVAREGGSCGDIVVNYHTEDGEGDPTIIAQDGKDYNGKKGEIIFHQGEKSKFIEIEIIDDCDYNEKCEHFFIQLDAVEVRAGSGRRASVAPGIVHPAKVGRLNRIRVDITNDTAHHQMVDRIREKVRSELDIGSKLWTGSWGQQFRDAFSIGGDGEVLSPIHYLMHFLTFVWKVIFAAVPPPEYAGGWACFAVALIFIGMLTKMVEEVATLLGCAMGLKKVVTAITFVSLGTSLPDTFASKQAVEEEEYADAAVGNVTGSNSVNVFLGLGLPWVVASCYYTAKDTCYVIPSGDLAFSVLVFASCGVCGLGILFFLRLGHPQKAELGGSLAVPLAVFFVFLWILYVLLSALQVYHNFAGSLRISACPRSCADGSQPNSKIIENWANLYPDCGLF
eukprot:Hpha_TRINITY_DN15757_c2_g11::TRINITY_DN15757_c2_g11_i1::g.37618::m.37618/K05849/SLC8A, NCX; solute carrier family 8 (sodium/calcium exchanger)